MLMLDREQVRNRLPWDRLIGAMEDMFRQGCVSPRRHHHDVVGESGKATVLLMPAWQPDRTLGVKIVNVFPQNRSRGIPSVFGIYVLFDGTTGEPNAVVDGTELTARRTAAASALASKYLSRPDARCHLMVGTGRLSLNLIEAHRQVRPIEQVIVWGRNPDKAASIATQAVALGIEARATEDLASAVRQADIVTCATLSPSPLIKGEWLIEGTHVDLVGSFRPDLRESDDEVLRRADIIAVDTRVNALIEAGDIVQALKNNAISTDDISAELADLVNGHHCGRSDPKQITVYKSVGASIEDLAAALLAVETKSPPSGIAH
jgi:ornithine cyclodeaminase/alanine dehydrogenase-like protein (mu-crystallin family)